MNELHRYARRNYRRRHVHMIGIDNHWQADLVDVSSIAKFNRKHTFILTIIDTFSKYAYLRGLKSKGGEEVMKALKSVFEDSKRTPVKLESDRGKEFYNKHVQKLLKDKNISHYSTYSEMKVNL